MMVVVVVVVVEVLVLLLLLLVVVIERIQLMLTNLGVTIVGQSDTVAWTLSSLPLRTSSHHASTHRVHIHFLQLQLRLCVIP